MRSETQHLAFLSLFEAPVAAFGKFQQYKEVVDCAEEYKARWMDRTYVA